ncbi:hypothetical protein JCM9279_005324 [Rhodotorula babjevae]
MASKMPPAAERVPLELIIRVVEVAAARLPSSRADIGAYRRLLYSACLTCRALRPVAQPLLWQWAHVRGDAGLAALEREARARPDLAQRVRGISLWASPLDSVEEHLAEVLALLPAVRYCELVGDCVFDLSALQAAQGLEHIRLRGSMLHSSTPFSLSTVRTLALELSMVTSPTTWLGPTSFPGLSTVTVSQCTPQDGLVDDLLKAFGPDLQVLSRSTMRDALRLEPRTADAVTLVDLARLARHPVLPPSPGRAPIPKNRHSILRIVDARPSLGLDALLTLRTALPWLRGHELWVPRALLHDAVGAAWAQLERDVAHFGGRLTPYDLELFERRSHQETHAKQLQRINELLSERVRALPDLPVISTKDAIEHALAVLPDDLPLEGLGLEATTSHLLSTISPALSPGQAGPRCFALITGGVTPAAQLADMLVTSFDPCVQVHWPEQTISVALEALTLSYLLDLLDLPSSTFTQNTLTTGATASNLLGVCTGRDWVVARVKHAQGERRWSVPEDGMGGVEVDVFVADAHASVRKAAALAGLGRRSVVQVGDAAAEREGRLVSMDLVELERRLHENKERGRGSIVVTSFGEVNTGAINADTPAVRALCDQYGAWLHIDAAFAAFAVLHPDFAPYKPHLALADSITSDAHKWLNVPYDCGIYISRSRPVDDGGEDGRGQGVTASLYDLCGPGDSAPAYLATPAASEGSAASSHPRVEASKALKSPLFQNVENSRRFRALPLYASLLSLGRGGYARLVERNVAFARRVEAFLRTHPAYDILTPAPSRSAPSLADDPFAFRILNIVLFAPSSLAPERYRVATAANPDPAATFLGAINATNEVFCTGTTWRGRKAVRLAVSNWQTELVEGREWEVVRRVLERVASE